MQFNCQFILVGTDQVSALFSKDLGLKKGFERMNNSENNIMYL